MLSMELNSFDTLTTRLNMSGVSALTSFMKWNAIFYIIKNKIFFIDRVSLFLSGIFFLSKKLSVIT